MTWLKCKKCGNVFEMSFGSGFLAPHLGPYHYFKCPACAKSSWFNLYSSVKDSVTFPPSEKKAEEQPEMEMSETEREKRRIEESKYEKP